MASVTLNNIPLADNTTISVYTHEAYHDGHPAGSAVTTGTVSSGSVTLSSVVGGVAYVATDGAGWHRAFEPDVAATPGVPTFAGAPTDAAYPGTPVNGSLALDTTNHRLYVRDGTWKYTALT